MKLSPSNINSPTTYLPETVPITGLMTVKEPMALKTLKEPMTPTLDQIYSRHQEVKSQMQSIETDRANITAHESNPFDQDGYIRQLRSREQTAFEDALVISEQQNTIFILGAVTTVTLIVLIGSYYIRK
jgi:hypothetical protein